MSKSYDAVGHFVIGRSDKSGFIQQGRLPPSSSRWTAELGEAQYFNSLVEAIHTAEYISRHALDVVVLDTDNDLAIR